MPIANRPNFSNKKILVENIPTPVKDISVKENVIKKVKKENLQPNFENDKEKIIYLDNEIFKLVGFLSNSKSIVDIDKSLLAKFHNLWKDYKNNLEVINDYLNQNNFFTQNIFQEDLEQFVCYWLYEKKHLFYKDCNKLITNIDFYIENYITNKNLKEKISFNKILLKELNKNVIFEFYASLEYFLNENNLQEKFNENYILQTLGIISELTSISNNTQNLKNEIENNDLKDKSNNLTKNETDNLEDEPDNLENKTDNLENEIDNLENETNNLKNEPDNLENENDNLENETDNLENEIDNLENETSNLENETDNLENEPNDLENETDNLENKSNNSEYEPDDLEDESNDLENEIENNNLENESDADIEYEKNIILDKKVENFLKNYNSIENQRINDLFVFNYSTLITNFNELLNTNNDESNIFLSKDEFLQILVKELFVQNKSENEIIQILSDVEKWQEYLNNSNFYIFKNIEKILIKNFQNFLNNNFNDIFISKNNNQIISPLNNKLENDDNLNQDLSNPLDIEETPLNTDDEEPLDIDASVLDNDVNETIQEDDLINYKKEQQVQNVEDEETELDFKQVPQELSDYINKPIENINNENDVYVAILAYEKMLFKYQNIIQRLNISANQSNQIYFMQFIDRFDGIAQKYIILPPSVDNNLIIKETLTEILGNVYNSDDVNYTAKNLIENIKKKLNKNLENLGENQVKIIDNPREINIDDNIIADINKSDNFKENSDYQPPTIEESFDIKQNSTLKSTSYNENLNQNNDLLNDLNDIESLLDDPINKKKEIELPEIPQENNQNSNENIFQNNEDLNQNNFENNQNSNEKVSQNNDKENQSSNEDFKIDIDNSNDKENEEFQNESSQQEPIKEEKPKTEVKLSFKERLNLIFQELKSSKSFQEKLEFLKEQFKIIQKELKENNSKKTTKTPPKPKTKPKIAPKQTSKSVNKYTQTSIFSKILIGLFGTAIAAGGAVYFGNDFIKSNTGIDVKNIITSMVGLNNNDMPVINKPKQNNQNKNNQQPTLAPLNQNQSHDGMSNLDNSPFNYPMIMSNDLNENNLQQNQQFNQNQQQFNSNQQQFNQNQQQFQQNQQFNQNLENSFNQNSDFENQNNSKPAAQLKDFGTNWDNKQEQNPHNLTLPPNIQKENNKILEHNQKVLERKKQIEQEKLKEQQMRQQQQNQFFNNGFSQSSLNQESKKKYS